MFAIQRTKFQSAKSEVLRVLSCSSFAAISFIRARRRSSSTVVTRPHDRLPFPQPLSKSHRVLKKQRSACRRIVRWKSDARLQARQLQSLPAILPEVLRPAFKTKRPRATKRCRFEHFSALHLVCYLHVASSPTRQQRREARLFQNVARVVARNGIAAKPDRNSRFEKPGKRRDAVAELCV